MSSSPVIHSQPYMPINEFQEYVEKAQALSESMQRWNSERSALLSLLTQENPTLTEAQFDRVRDLSSSLDTYAMCLEEGGEIPTATWIDRANSNQPVIGTEG